jgi:hypothetical protein
MIILTNDGGLQVDEHGSGNMLARSLKWKIFNNIQSYQLKPSHYSYIL